MFMLLHIKFKGRDLGKTFQNPTLHSESLYQV